MKIRTVLSGYLSGGVFIILLPATAMYLNSYFNLPIFENVTYVSIGYVFFVVGIFIFIHCAELFVKVGKGTPAPIEPPKEIVVKGLYRFTRNPMYLGYFLIFFGLFFIFGHLLLLIYTFFIIIFLHLYVVYVEEPKLKKRFGKVYEEYVSRVPRWLIGKGL